jgi:hypothetical protein|tara:strand:- start:282 stop:680 length:399 start_codon:yes stop_codon:yes gene_type:complete
MRKQQESHIVWNEHNPDDKIGRGNYKDVIHHRDGNHDNNNISNLQKMTHGKHKSLHAKGHKWWVGKKHTKETKKKIGAKSKGRKPNLGRKFSDEVKNNMSKSRKKWWEKNTVSEETREKLRDAANKRWRKTA